MKASQLAVALAFALATTAGFAAGADNAAETDRTWYQTGEFEQQSEQGKVNLERQGFPQYIP
ncbi:MAG: hypothetical protein ACREVS_10480 [Burkholderiales bacterium]